MKRKKFYQLDGVCRNSHNLIIDLWNPPTNWTARTLKERTPLHVWEVDALRAGLVAEACKKFKNATSPLIRWMIRDELAAKVTELYRRPVF